MRLIDADALTKRHCEYCTEDVRKSCIDDPVCASLMWVIEEPTVDAVPVVRCRDCKHFYYDTDKEPSCAFVCGLPRPREDDFCSYGERREEHK